MAEGKGEAPGLTTLGADGSGAAVLEERLDRHAVTVEYESRKTKRIMAGVFEFKALGVADLREVMLWRLRFTAPFDWTQLTENEQALWQAVAHLTVALTKWPDWYDRDGKSTDLGQDLYVGLFAEYAGWDAGLFRSGAEGRASEASKPVLVIRACVGSGDGA
jgi:hypothetical protein